MPAPNTVLDAELAEARTILERMGLARPGEALDIQPLTGGVSSDIWRIRKAAGTFVLKKAREQLKVDAEWHAPIDRGAAEAAWLAFVAAAAPGHAPAVLAVDEPSFAMALEYLDADTFANWKTQLLAGHVDPRAAAAVGRTLGRIHAASTRTAGLAEQFANQELFESLRIEPYLRRTAQAVPSVKEELGRIIEGLESTQLALVHGDLSPKNILVGEGDGVPHPVILDAECATWGDPAFDAAFCLTHLAIKELHLPAHAADLRVAAGAFEAAYLAEVTWEEAESTRSRIGRILPALVLARMAGASPVEYLEPDERAALAALAIAALRSGDSLRDTMDNTTGNKQ